MKTWFNNRCTFGSVRRKPVKTSRRSARRHRWGFEQLEARELLASDMPNVLVINTDDQRWDSLPFMPVLQAQLAPNSTVFTNSFVTTPICAPSRASLFTGMYAFNHGVLHVDEPWGGFENFNDTSTLATWLDSAGYNTAMVGKYINGYDLGAHANSNPNDTYVPPGWDYWRAFLGASYVNPLISFDGESHSFDGQYSTDVLSDLAVQFINSNSSSDDVPFFLYFAPHNPHEPSLVAPRHQGVYDDIAPFRPPSFNEADVSDKPSWVASQLPVLDANDIAAGDQFRKDQLESMLSVDDGLGRMMDALRDSNQLSNTIIIFTSDNGQAWGEHRLYDKGPSWDESIRVPLVVYDGRNPVSQVVDEMALNIDLAPTIMQYAGLPLPQPIDGESLVPLINNQSVPWRDEFLVDKYVGDGGKYYSIRTERYSYTEYTSGSRELYDLQNDPYELQSLHNDPAYAAVRADLSARLSQLKPSDVTGPITSNLQYQTTISGNRVLSSTLSDATTGGSPVRSAEYYVGAPGGNGNGQSMRPLDGVYDSAAENMVVDFPNLAPGSYTVYVHGRDVAGNWGPFVAIPVQVEASTQGLSGEYFNGIDLTGTAGTRVDPMINFPQDWGNAPAGTNVTPDDNFSARWTGFAQASAAGNWTFFTTSNDGVRLWIDNTLVIDNWTTHAVVENSATVALSAGWHPIRLEYFQQGGVAELTLAFQGPGQAKATIPPTKLSVTEPQESANLAIAAASASKNEGNAGSTPFTFTVTRSGDTSGTTTVDYSVTGSGAATANFADFGGFLPSDTVTFTAGQTSTTITINVSGDVSTEPDEGFTVTLSNPSGGAQITTATAAGVIINDDSPVGQNGLVGEYFNATNLTGFAGTRVDPTVNFPQDWGSAPPGTAVTPDDNFSARWTGFVETSSAGSWTFFTTSNDGVRLWIDNALVIDNWTTHAVTQNSAVLALTAGWHAIRLEYFQQGGVAEITLSFQGPSQAKTIISQSKLLTTAPNASLSIVSASSNKSEGNLGPTPFTFTVTRSGNTSGTTTVNYSVVGTNPSPADAADFGGSFPSGLVTFTDGQLSQTIAANVTGDATIEPDESFTVTISGATGGAQITTAAATGIILNDDALPSFGGLLGEYFNAIDLSGLASTRVDPTVNFTQNWNGAPPGTNLTSDGNYSVRWTGQVQTSTAGSWTFFSTSNDGARLWIDDVLIINNWTQHAITQNSATLSLSAGWHAIRLEYFQQGAAAEITLSYQGPGQPKAIIPESKLQPLQAQLTDSMLVGGVTSDKAKVSLRVDHASSVAVEYSTSPTFSVSMTSPTIVTNSSGDYTAILALANLSPKTKYYYRALIGGIPVSDGVTRSFVTFASPGSTDAFTFAVTADLQNAATFPTYAAPAYASIAAENPSFMLQLGDFDHRNPTTLEQMRNMHRQVRSPGKAAGADFAQYIAPNMPVDHIWDDHDYGFDDGDKTFPGKAAALQAFGEYYPTTDRPNAAGIWHSFQYGIADFFMLDVRSQRDPNADPDGPEKSMIDGDKIANGQLDWLKQGLLNSTATWKFIASGVAFNPTTKPYDSWGSHPRERQEIVDFINSHGISGVIFISGDLHTGGAIDNGTNSAFPELSVPHTNLQASMESSGITGTWSEGADSGAISGGYATVVVSPSQVVLQTRAEDGTIKKSFTVHAAAGIVASPPSSQSSIEVLPGDYDRNDVVDQADLSVWRHQFGEAGAGLNADGNQNGVVDAADYVIWRSHLGMKRIAGTESAAPFPVALPARSVESMPANKIPTINTPNLLQMSVFLTRSEEILTRDSRPRPLDFRSRSHSQALLLLLEEPARPQARLATVQLVVNEHQADSKESDDPNIVDAVFDLASSLAPVSRWANCSIFSNA